MRNIVCYISVTIIVTNFVSDYNSISKFLNRILGMEVALQNALFKYFSDTLAAIILEAKRSGRWDMGILGRHVLEIITDLARSCSMSRKFEKCGVQRFQNLFLWKKIRTIPFF